MSNVAKRPSRTPRRVREKRAYQLVVVAGIAGAVAVVGFVLALFAGFDVGIPLLATVLAATCYVIFRGMVRPR